MDWTYYFNTDKYTVAQLVMCALGGAMWAILYILMLLNIRKHKYVEMPYFVAAGNIAWEFLWAWVYADHIDLGAAYVFLYRCWFFFDLFIFSHVFQYGHKQIVNPYVRERFKPILITLVIVWAGLIYSYMLSSLDYPLGVNSAYVLNLIITVLYIQLYMRQWQSGKFLKSVAWLKMLGSGIITVAFWSMINIDAPPNPVQYFEHIAGPVVFVIDCFYIYMIYNWNKPQVDPAFEL
ncbi:MAG: hypothetical protein GC181_13005 [Bacteroidetes bacterium]|nr:hypothetical protein [Bacteroidota bacterium]